jgi:UDP-N-acetylmuramoyl-tripeptide--D-alanyl-D-alanine ligase
MKSWALKEIAHIFGLAINSVDEVKNICTDTRSLQKGDLFVALVGDKYDGHNFVEMAFGKGAAACLCSKPMDVAGGLIILVKDTKEALLKLAAIYRERVDLKVIGVTGSVGKTTTKDMIAQALSAEYEIAKTQGNLNNEIGVPQTIFSIEDHHDAAVVEMGISDIGEMPPLAKCVKPDIGVITSIGHSHLEYFGTRENILKSKLEIVTGMPPGAPLVLNYDNELLSPIAAYMDHPVLSYGIQNPDANIIASRIFEDEKKLETNFQINDGDEVIFCKIPCLGTHNVLNALAAYCVVKLLGLDRRKCMANLSGFRPSGMRQNIVNKNGIIFIEDCYNAAPESMLAALTTLSKLSPERGGRRIAVLGDMLELGEQSKDIHKFIGQLVADMRIGYLYAYGNSAYYIVDSAERNGFSSTYFSNSKEEITKKLLGTIRDGDVILFKASNGMGMKDIIDSVYRKLDEKARLLQERYS